MIAELGHFCLWLALALSLAQAVFSGAGRARHDPVMVGVGRGAAVAAFLAIAAAFAALMHAFITSDFSVANVAANSHTAKPLLYKIAGTWGSHEGSMLLWCLALTGFGAAAAMAGTALPFGLRAMTVCVQGALGVLFVGYTTLASNPLWRVASPPIEGNSLNPLLQDPALAFHPPLLYAGYVGLSVVFSLSLAALIEGRADAAWARWVRPWTLAAWSFLTVGITLGSFWAYYELGWGGWWFWDPVENASFMPWLAATALLHSSIVTEKRGALVGWTVFLAITAFTLSMLGAFLVRSGVLTSVHAFAVDPTRGVLLLSILGLAAGAGFALFAWRAERLRDEGVFAPISRESALVINNIVLAAATTSVLLGTLYPLIHEAFGGGPLSVGPPYFNLTFAPLMALALLILPAGPLLAWKRGDALGAAQRLWVVGLISLTVGLGVFALTSPRRALACAGIALASWLMLGALVELGERLHLLRASLAESGRRMAALPRGAWGMTLAHLGLGVFILGASVETAWKVDAAEVLRAGGRMALGAYELRLDNVGVVEGPNYSAERGQVRVLAGTRVICEGTPERRFYPAGGQTTSEVAICQRGLDDVYLVMGEQRPQADGTPSWLVRAYVNPMARLIFLGPLLMALGGLISLSDRRLRFALPRKKAKSVVAPA